MRKLIHLDDGRRWRQHGEQFERRYRFPCLRNARVSMEGVEVTGDKGIEAAIRESEERYRTLFTSIQEGFALGEAVCDTSGRIVDFRFLEANPAFLHLTGLADVAGRTMGEAAPAAVSWLERFAAAVETGERVAFQARAPASRDNWLQVSAARAGAPERRRIAVLLNDITAQRRSEQALREREERLRLILESLTEYAVITLDHDGFVTGWNTGAKNLLGYEADEIVGEDGRIIFTPEDREKNAPDRELSTALDRGRAINERWHLRKDGSRFWGSGLVMPLRVEDEGATGLVKIMRDMTPEREHAERLALEDRRKDEFLATLAHELRNPLAPMAFALEIMKQSPGDEGLGQQARETIERQVTHMMRLVDDLLDLGRITRDRLELRTERADLRGIVDQAVEATRPALEEADHELSLNLPEEPIMLQADVARMTQVLVNLLTNAFKFTPRGGHVTLSAQVERRQVEGREGPRPEAVIEVRDDGSGIPGDMLPRVFDMFVQADSTYEHRSQGLGIGLRPVRRLVEMHGGSVSADSAGPGQGAAFTVRLPLDTEEATGRDAGGVRPGTAPATLPAGTMFLVVDDNRDSADALATLLRSAGHTVDVAYDGHGALDRLAAEPADVVLLDIGLPDINGYDVCREIRGSISGRGVVVIALTGWGLPMDREESVVAGFDAHLVKPVRFATLIGTIAPLLGRQAG